eukprot:GEMP01005781.1.p1 GENE.GEMP01005781.1~~GEMP01005781.1.p1  ORF type:complete len:969 (+),score=282.73 GEMP01005781.1:271-3177(+)
MASYWWPHPPPSPRSPEHHLADDSPSPAANRSIRPPYGSPRSLSVRFAYPSTSTPPAKTTPHAANARLVPPIARARSNPEPFRPYQTSAAAAHEDPSPHRYGRKAPASPPAMRRPAMYTRSAMNDDACLQYGTRANSGPNSAMIHHDDPSTQHAVHATSPHDAHWVNVHHRDPYGQHVMYRSACDASGMEHYATAPNRATEYFAPPNGCQVNDARGHSPVNVAYISSARGGMACEHHHCPPHSPAVVHQHNPSHLRRVPYRANNMAAFQGGGGGGNSPAHYRGHFPICARRRGNPARTGYSSRAPCDEPVPRIRRPLIQRNTAQQRCTGSAPFLFSHPAKTTAVDVGARDTGVQRAKNVLLSAVNTEGSGTTPDRNTCAEVCGRDAKPKNAACGYYPADCEVCRCPSEEDHGMCRDECPRGTPMWGVGGTASRDQHAHKKCFQPRIKPYGARKAPTRRAWERQCAAQFIQRLWRGISARRALWNVLLRRKKEDFIYKKQIRRQVRDWLDKQKRTNAVIVIQAHWRRSRAARIMRTQKRRIFASQWCAALKIQTAWRGHVAREWGRYLRYVRLVERVRARKIASQRARKFELIAREEQAVLKIQRAWRRVKRRRARRVTHMLHTAIERALLMQQSARRIQAYWRLMCAKASADRQQQKTIPFLRVMALTHRKKREKELQNAATTIGAAWKGHHARTSELHVVRRATVLGRHRFYDDDCYSRIDEERRQRRLDAEALNNRRQQRATRERTGAATAIQRVYRAQRGTKVRDVDRGIQRARTHSCGATHDSDNSEERDARRRLIAITDSFPARPNCNAPPLCKSPWPWDIARAPCDIELSSGRHKTTNKPTPRSHKTANKLSSGRHKTANKQIKMPVKTPRTYGDSVKVSLLVLMMDGKKVRRKGAWNVDGCTPVQRFLGEVPYKSLWRIKVLDASGGVVNEPVALSTEVRELARFRERVHLVCEEVPASQC